MKVIASIEDPAVIKISAEMLERLQLKHSFDNVRCGSMDDLSMFDDGEFHYVICINSAFSLASDAHVVLDGIHRILKPEGRLFLSVLNRWALRRLVRGLRGKRETFATCNAETGFGTVPAVTYTATELSQAMFCSRVCR